MPQSDWYDCADRNASVLCLVVPKQEGGHMCLNLAGMIVQTDTPVFYVL